MARRSVHKPEPRKERPRIFLCETHRRAMEQLYYLDEVERIATAASGLAMTAGGQKTAGEGKDPSAPLRSAQDDKGDGGANGGEWGVCFGCMKTAWGKLYAMEPRRARYRTSPRGGGGERARAGNT